MTRGVQASLQADDPAARDLPPQRVSDLLAGPPEYAEAGPAKGDDEVGDAHWLSPLKQKQHQN